MKPLLIALPLVAMMSLPSLAQQAPQGQPPQMPVGEIAADMGLPEGTMKSCLEANAPGKDGARPQGQRRGDKRGQQDRDGKRGDGKRSERGDRGERGGRGPGSNPEFLSCLQKANPALTGDKVNEVMRAHRPAPPQGQAQPSQ